MKKLPVKSVVKGFDVSHYQPHVDFKALKAQGYAFCFAKASEGIHYVDASFKSHRENAKAAGLIFGAYHFFHPKYDPVAQATHFMSVVGKVQPGELPLVMDWETTDNKPSAADTAAGREFLEALRRMSGYLPRIYCGPYFGQALKLDSYFKQFPLWVAHYGTSAPLIPEPWDACEFWQFSDKGVGDQNYFNGTLEQLKALRA